MMSIHEASGKYSRTIAGSPKILWQGCQPEQLVGDFGVQEPFICSNGIPQSVLVHELQQVLARLFPYTHVILVEALTHGFSTARVVKVQPFYERGGGARHVIVKFGEIEVIKQEYENYQRYVQHFIGDGRSTTILGYQQTKHLAAISYAFLGTGMHQMQEFGSFYEQASAAQIRSVLDQLFRQTCGMWYANHDALQPVNLTEDYQRYFGYEIQAIEKATIACLRSVSWQQTLMFDSLRYVDQRHLPNPFSLLKTAQPVVRTTYRCVTHGDLNQRNILIDAPGSAWLIDFQSTGPSHILRDVAMLDTVIRLQLLRSKQATLAERLVLEEAIGTLKHFDPGEVLHAEYRTDNPFLVKTWETMVHLRKIAHWIIEKNPLCEMSEYTFALLYSTINTLNFTSLEIVQREHALLSASILVDTLGKDGILADKS